MSADNQEFVLKITDISCDTYDSTWEDPGKPAKILMVACEMEFNCGKYGCKINPHFEIFDDGKIIINGRSQKDKSVKIYCGDSDVSCGLTNELTYPCIEKIEMMRDKFVELAKTESWNAKISAIMRNEFC